MFFLLEVIVIFDSCFLLCDLDQANSTLFQKEV